MSFARRQEKILAMKASAPASGGGHTRPAAAIPQAAAEQAPIPAGNTPAARAASTVAMRLRHDIQRLKQIKSIDRKIAAKREMLPEYQAWCDGLLDAGRRAETRELPPTGADDVLPTIMVWHLDVGDWTRALMLAAFVLRFSIPMPKRYERDAATLVLELIADAALKVQARGDASPPIASCCCAAPFRTRRFRISSPMPPAPRSITSPHWLPSPAWSSRQPIRSPAPRR
jgi:hypothetical protein